MQRTVYIGRQLIEKQRFEKVKKLNKAKLQSMDETGKKLKELQGEFESMKDTWENPDLAESSYV